MSIHIARISITDIQTDCVVNAANEGLWEGGGVCGAIFRAAGSAELTEACQAIGHCDTGSAVITPGFRLKAKYIIHAVGPRYRDGNHGEPEQLYGAYRRSLELAKEYGCRSIAFPLISSGIFGYPKEAAWKKAIQACADFEKKTPDYPMDIFFTVLDDRMAEMGQKTIREVLEESPAAAERQQPAPKKRVTAEERVRIFQDTQEWIKLDPTLSASVAWSKRNTEVFFEDEYPAFDQTAVREQTVNVTPERSYQAAMRLAKENPDARIAVMNFANAFQPGGGVTRGASAQEESLCRCSTLYPLLYRNTLRYSFYQHHKDLNTSKASDSLVYTEGVIICKTDTDYPERMPQEDWTAVDVITIAAPDLRDKSNRYAALLGGGTYMNNAELFGYHVKRAIHMLTVAAAKGADILVLGAFGCGAFENDPEVVARAYKVALQEFPKVFQKIVFAIYRVNYDVTDNYEVFKRVLERSEF